MSDDLAIQISQLKNQIKSSNARLEAHVQVLNENLSSNLQLRSTISLIQLAHNEAIQELATVKAENLELARKLEAATIQAEPTTDSPVTVDSPNV